MVSWRFIKGREHTAWLHILQTVRHRWPAKGGAAWSRVSRVGFAFLRFNRHKRSQLQCFSVHGLGLTYPCDKWIPFNRDMPRLFCVVGTVSSRMFSGKVQRLCLTWGRHETKSRFAGKKRLRFISIYAKAVGFWNLKYDWAFFCYLSDDTPHKQATKRTGS